MAPIFSHPGVKLSLENSLCPNPDPSLLPVTRPVSHLGGSWTRSLSLLSVLALAGAEGTACCELLCQTLGPGPLHPLEGRPESPRPGLYPFPDARSLFSELVFPSSNGSLHRLGTG